MKKVERAHYVCTDAETIARSVVEPLVKGMSYAGELPAEF
jgi:hypothetical protein